MKINLIMIRIEDYGQAQQLKDSTPPQDKKVGKNKKNPSYSMQILA